MEQYAPFFASAGKQYGEDPLWIQAMAQQESAGNPFAVSPKGATGLMQLMPDTAAELGVTDSNDPEQNINGGSKYYSRMKKKYGDPNLALVAYNYGPGNTDKWIKAGGSIDDLPEETRNYIKRINANYRKYKKAQSPETIEELVIEPAAEKIVKPELTPQIQQSDLPSVKTEQFVNNLADQAAIDEDPFALADQLEAERKRTKPAITATQSQDALAISPEEDDPFSMADSMEKEQKQVQRKKIEETPGVVEDIAKTIPSAIVKGVGAIPQIPAMAGNFLGDTAAYTGTKLYNAFADKPLTEEQQQKIRKGFQPFFVGNTPFDALTQAGKAIVTGEPGDTNALTGDMLYEPKTTPGRFAQAATMGAVGGGLSGAYGPIKSGLSAAGGQAATELYPDNPLAQLAGGMVAPATGGGLKYVGGKLSPEVAQVVKDAADRGINVPVGMVSESPIARRTYSLLNRFGLTKDQTPEQFTGAVAKQIGINKNKLTNTVMADAKSEIGKMYEKVAEIAEANGGIKVSSKTLDGLQNLIDEGVDAAPQVNKFFNKLTSAINEDKLTVAQYKKLTEKGSLLSNLQNSEKSELRSVGNQIERYLLDDLSESAGSEAKKLVNQADKKYALWNLADAARDDVTGLVNPTTFSREAWNRNKNFFKSENNLRNPSETYTLSQIADQLKLLPSSQTAENAAMMALAHKVGGLVGSGLTGFAVAGGPASIIAPAVMAAGGKAVGSALSSNWYRNHLINQALSPPKYNPLGLTPPPNQ